MAIGRVAACAGVASDSDHRAYSAAMASFEDEIVRLFEQIHPLDRVPRSGYVLRGVTEAESVAAHSHAVALLALAVTAQYPDAFNAHKVLAMALVHDVAEARTMDIPLPVNAGPFRAGKQAAEQAVMAELLAGLPPTLAAVAAEWAEGISPEARLVHGLDKAQMLLKTLNYQREGRGDLAEFWQNPAHFNDYGLEPLQRLFAAIRAAAQRAGRMA